MYFSEQGNVDDDATLITIFLVSFNLQSCCLMQSAVCGLRSAVCSLQSAVCKCHTPLSETFGPRSIFSAHDNAGNKFDKYPISIDFTGYKTQTNLLFRAFLSLNLVVRLFVSNT